MSTQETSQKLSLVGAVLMNINLMVGASAFISPSMMAEHADSASFYSWIYAALLFFPVVWCVAQIAKLFPGKGSFFSYSNNVISKKAGFMSGWVYFLGYVSIGAMQTISLNEILTRQFNLGWLENHMLVFNLLLIGILLSLSWLSVHAIDRIQSNVTIFKITPLIIGVVSLLYYFSPATTPAFTQVSLSTITPTIPMAIFGFWGFEGVCSVSHLIQDGKRNTSRAIFLGFSIAVTVYTLFHLGMLSIMGAKALKVYGAVAFPNYMGLSSPLVVNILNVLITSAIICAHINAIFGGIIANSAMFCAMAEEKILFMSNFFSSRRAHTNRPYGAAIAHAAGLLFCITLLARKEVLNAMSNLGLLIAFFFSIIALIIVQRKRNDIKGQIVSVLGLASCCLLSFYSWELIGLNTWQRLCSSAPLIMVMLLGYIMFLHTRKCAKRA